MRIAVLILSLLAGAPGGLVAADPVLPAAPAGMQFVPALQDEFDGLLVDETKWLVMERERKFSTESRHAVTVTNGFVRLVAYSEAAGTNGPLRHYSGFLRSASPWQQTKGYFAARLRVHPAAGIDSCFWLMSPNLGLHGSQPELWAQDGAEVDIFEWVPHLGGNYLPTLHWGDYGTNHQSLHASANVKLKPGDWHVFAVLWDDSGYTFYCDNRQVARFTAQDKSLQRGVPVPVSVAPSNIQLSAGPNNWAGKPPKGGFGSSTNPTVCMDVDWVRTWTLAPVPSAAIAPATTNPTHAAVKQSSVAVEVE